MTNIAHLIRAWVVMGTGSVALEVQEMGMAVPFLTLKPTFVADSFSILFQAVVNGPVKCQHLGLNDIETPANHTPLPWTKFDLQMRIDFARRVDTGRMFEVINPFVVLESWSHTPRTEPRCLISVDTAQAFEVTDWSVVLSLHPHMKQTEPHCLFSTETSDCSYRSY